MQAKPYGMSIMANRNFPSNKLYQPHVMAVMLNAKISIGASGAVSSFKAPMIQSVTRLAAGLYQIQLQDNYSGMFNLLSSAVSPVTGSNVAAASWASGTAYQITVVGTTNYAAVGLNSALTPAVGMSFVATGAGSGTGMAKVIGNSGIVAIEQLDNGAELAPSPAPQLGGIINIQCLGATSSSVTTLIPADPANGSIICLSAYLNNSSVVTP